MRASGQRLEPVAPSPRKQPVRDGILAFLTRPRRPLEIARQMERSVPNITGHLRAMQRLNLVVRLAYGVYAPARAPYLHQAAQNPSPRRPKTADLIPAFLAKPRAVAEVVQQFGITEATARHNLNELRRRGLVERLEEGTYRSPPRPV
jgi:DNA-binding IclR family transcriptional regulator